MVICDNCGISMGVPQKADFDLVDVTSLSDKEKKYISMYTAACPIKHIQIGPGVWRGKDLRKEEMIKRMATDPNFVPTISKSDKDTGFFRGWKNA